MDASRGQMPSGLKGLCPYTVLGLCLSEEGQQLSVQQAAADEAAVSAREALSSKAIATAYRKAALKAHPDKNKGRETEAAADFLVVNLAFAFLSNAEQRAAYHEHLRTLLSLRQQRQQQQQRWTERDKQKQRFKEELQRKEAEARQKVSQAHLEEAALQRIREENYLFMKQQTELRQKQRQQVFIDHSTQLLQQAQQKQQQTPKGHSSVHATHATSDSETETEETVEDLLRRSLLLQWNTAASADKRKAAAAATTDACKQQQPNSTSPAAADAAPGVDAEAKPAAAAAEEATGTTADTAAAEGSTGDSNGAAAASGAAASAAAATGAAAEWPSPASLCSKFRVYGAVDLFMFSRRRGQACISFSTRERAIEVALLLQREKQRHRAEGDSKPKTETLNVKLANKVKGLEQLILNIRSVAAAADQQQQHQQQGETEDMREIAEMAAETEEAAGAFASALAAAQAAAAAAAAAAPHSQPAAAAAEEPQIVSDSSDSPPRKSSSSSSSSGSVNIAEATRAAAAFGLGTAATATKPISGAAACILEYVRSCSSKGLQEAQRQQEAAEKEKGWEWIGGSKVAASMTLQELEAAAFGELQRKRQQQQQQQQ